MMFLDPSNAMSHGLMFVARQREREVATKGVTSTRLPPPTNGMEKRKANHSAKDTAAIQTLIEEAMKLQEELIHGLSLRIHHTAQLADRMQGEGGDAEQHLVCVSMRKLKVVQQEYIQALFCKRALETLSEHHEYGLVTLKGVEKEIRAITMCNESNKKSTKTTASKWSDDELLLQLKKRKFFPILRIEDGSVAFGWTDIPPFCNHNVARQRAMEVATKGFTKIHIPMGYEKIENPCTDAVLLISQAEQHVVEFNKQLHKLNLQIHLLVKAATGSLEHGNSVEACLRMKEMESIQAEYLAILKVLEGIKVLVSDIQHGVIDLNLGSQTLEDICDLSNSNVEAEEDLGDEEYLSRLEEKQFYPRLFSLVGGEGVRIFYRATAPDKKGASAPKSIEEAPNKTRVSFQMHQPRREMVSRVA
ncbi:unnamed protein product [Cylindrotheca closterium]|uniref:Uncharacterized protein n=1 Tax=Cylindrotheca closterium TaxID=2856 RepID=A0AAD2CM08_9STRA|nr:unnamed protein product [Cylindrotheca closterium]